MTEGTAGVMERRKTEREGLPSHTPGSASRLIALLFNRRTRDNWGQVSAKNSQSDLASQVTLLARPTFLDINTLAGPTGSTQSRRDNQSMRERCFRQSEHAFLL